MTNVNRILEELNWFTLFEHCGDIPTLVYPCNAIQRMNREESRIVSCTVCQEHFKEKKTNVCVAIHPFEELPEKYQYGILAHEIGHLIQVLKENSIDFEDEESGEYEANELFEEYYWTPIFYEDYDEAKGLVDLEYLLDDDIKKIHRIWSESFGNLKKREEIINQISKEGQNEYYK